MAEALLKKKLSEVDDKKVSRTVTTKVIEADNKVAKDGDKVDVDYVGYLGEFVIFDTSIEDIGQEANRVGH